MDIATFQREDLLNKHEEKIRIFLYTIIMLTLGIYFFQIQAGGNSWKTGDWLINYQGGFVRRGLIGEILYIFSPDGWLLLLTFLMQATIYAIICHFTINEFFSKKRGLIDGIIIFSPAFIFMFPFYSFQGGMRKELIAFLSFILLLEAIKKNKNNWALFSSLIIYTLGVFSHEMIALFVFFYIYILLKRPDYSFKQKVFYIFIWITISCFGLYLSTLFHGDILVAHSICSSLVATGIDPDICEGAISSLSGTALSSLLWVESKSYNYLLYVPLFILSLIPISFIYWRKYLLIVLVGFISILPLFIIAIDWGRWIHIYITFLSLIYIYDDKTSIKQNITKPLLVFFIFYLISWRLPLVNPNLMKIKGAYMIPYKIWNVFSDIISSV